MKDGRKIAARIRHQKRTAATWNRAASPAASGIAVKDEEQTNRAENGGRISGK